MPTLFKFIYLFILDAEKSHPLRLAAGNEVQVPQFSGPKFAVIKSASQGLCTWHCDRGTALTHLKATHLRVCV